MIGDYEGAHLVTAPNVPGEEVVRPLNEMPGLCSSLVEAGAQHGCVLYATLSILDVSRRQLNSRGMRL
jgi:hypothetical protein